MYVISLYYLNWLLASSRPLCIRLHISSSLTSSLPLSLPPRPISLLQSNLHPHPLSLPFLDLSCSLPLVPSLPPSRSISISFSQPATVDEPNGICIPRKGFPECLYDVLTMMIVTALQYQYQIGTFGRGRASSSAWRMVHILTMIMVTALQHQHRDIAIGRGRASSSAWRISGSGTARRASSSSPLTPAPWCVCVWACVHVEREKEEEK